MTSEEIREIAESWLEDSYNISDSGIFEEAIQDLVDEADLYNTPDVHEDSDVAWKAYDKYLKELDKMLDEIAADEEYAQIEDEDELAGQIEADYDDEVHDLLGTAIEDAAQQIIDEERQFEEENYDEDDEE